MVDRLISSASSPVSVFQPSFCSSILLCSGTFLLLFLFSNLYKVFSVSLFILAQIDSYNNCSPFLIIVWSSLTIEGIRTSISSGFVWTLFLKQPPPTHPSAGQKTAFASENPYIHCIVQILQQHFSGWYFLVLILIHPHSASNLAKISTFMLHVSLILTADVEDKM